MKDIVLELGSGIDIKEAADLAVKLAQKRKTEITLVYNKIKINVSPDTAPQYIVNAFFASAASQADLAIQQPQNKICYKPHHGYFNDHIKYGLWLARKYKKPVVLQYAKKNMILTPGDGYLLNNAWLLLRLTNLATQCEYGD